MDSGAPIPVVLLANKVRCLLLAVAKRETKQRGETERQRNGDRNRNRETGRETDRQTDRQRDRETER